MRHYYIYTLLLCFLFGDSLFAQQQPLQFFRENDKRGLNQFETGKEDTVEFKGLNVRVGGDFAMQFQGIEQSNDMGNLVDLGQDFNLPSANLNLDVQLQDGVRMHLRTYLSSRHHYEAWIKGGHIQIDKLNFIKDGFLEGLMKYSTIRIGLDEFNYGDTRFRRSDNARAIFNPFVGNYLMDSFSTEAFGEYTFQYQGFLAVLGVSNGKLNQNVRLNENSDNQPSFFGKLGYDKQLNDDLRVRLTGSWYVNHGSTTGTWLYGGDRAGSRYYNVLHTAEGGSNFEGRHNARFTKITAFQINPFVKFKGLEFFGVYEVAMGNDEISPNIREGEFTQIGAELLYRFGSDEKLFIGGRYNHVFGKRLEIEDEDIEITRVNAGIGWFMTRNILLKGEYVIQNYEGPWLGKYAGAEFKGIVLEAVIGF